TPYRRTHPDHRAGPDLHTLVDDGTHADVDPGPDPGVPADLYRVGEDHAVVQDAVVPDVAAGEQVAVVADRRRIVRALVDRDVLADDVAVADLYPGSRQLPLPADRVPPAPVLRRGTDDDVRRDPVAVADPARADDHGVRPDDIVLAELDAGTDDRGRVDPVHECSGTRAACSAS